MRRVRAWFLRLDGLWATNTKRGLSVIVINEAAARRFWPGESPVGKQIELLGPNQTTLTVIGCSGDVRQQGLGISPRPEIFLDYLQPGPGWPWLSLVVRTREEPMAQAGAIRGAAQSVDRDVPILQIRSMDEVLSGSLAQPRVYTLLLGTFAALALALAAVGLYGVVSYAVTQRTHEVGVRMALGAGRENILRLVLREGLSLALAGIAIGLVCALAATRVLRTLVESVEPGDPLALASVTLSLLVVALAASYVPARRASKVDPIVALRHE